MENLLYVADLKTFSKGESIFIQGEEAEGFYIVFKGDILVTYRIQKNYYENLVFDQSLLTGNDDEEELKMESQSSAADMRIVKTEASDNPSTLDGYRQSYHLLVNRSKRKHLVAKDVEIKVVGPGQLLGSEDAVLNNSNHKINKFSYTAKCKSATCRVLYFSKKQ